MNTNQVPASASFEDSKVAKLRRRIHLPPELYKEVHEERFLGAGWHIKSNWLSGYNTKSGWTVCWLTAKYPTLKAAKVEVILRRHPILGNFILFRIWKE